MVPALREPRGVPRVRALFDRWLAWGLRPGGCFFIGASAELDDRPGAPREALSQACKDWIDELTKAAQIGIREGHLRTDLDAAQFAFEEYGIMLATHTFYRFLCEPDALERSRQAFERLLGSALSPTYLVR